MPKLSPETSGCRRTAGGLLGVPWADPGGWLGYPLALGRCTAVWGMG